MKILKRNLINNVLVGLVFLLQMSYLLVFYLKNKLYLKYPSITGSLFKELQTYNTIANVITIILAGIVVIYGGYILLKIKEKRIVLQSLAVVSGVFVISVIFYQLFLKNIYYEVIMIPFVLIGLLIVVLGVRLVKLRK